MVHIKKKILKKINKCESFLFRVRETRNRGTQDVHSFLESGGKKRMSVRKTLD